MIFNPVIVGGGTKLPELTNPGTAADLLAPKQLIDAEGNALTGTIATKTATNLTASGATVTVPAGYYAANVSKSVATATQVTPSISVSSAGLITASTTQTAGYVTAGTKSATLQLTTQAAQTITPGTTNKTIASGRYLTGVQTIKGEPNLLEENIRDGISMFGLVGTYSGANVINAEALGESAFSYNSSTEVLTITLAQNCAQLLGLHISVWDTYSAAIVYPPESSTGTYPGRVEALWCTTKAGQLSGKILSSSAVTISGKTISIALSSVTSSYFTEALVNFEGRVSYIAA